jgi:hypothetical protein
MIPEFDDGFLAMTAAGFGGVAGAYLFDWMGRDPATGLVIVMAVILVLWVTIGPRGGTKVVSR